MYFSINKVNRTCDKLSEKKNICHSPYLFECFEVFWLSAQLNEQHITTLKSHFRSCINRTYWILYICMSRKLSTRFESIFWFNRTSNMVWEYLFFCNAVSILIIGNKLSWADILEAKITIYLKKKKFEAYELLETLRYWQNRYTEYTKLAIMKTVVYLFLDKWSQQIDWLFEAPMQTNFSI